MTNENPAGRPLSELSDSGLLWLINRSVFHPRGLALALHKGDDGIAGWSLIGDGSEAWTFPDDRDQDQFQRAQATLDAARNICGTEEAGRVLGQALRAVVDELELSPEQAEHAIQVVPKVLQNLTVGEVG